MKVVSWRIEIEFEDGDIGYLSDIPKDVANMVDEYLSELEAD